MLYFVQSAANVPVQICEAGTNLSWTMVDSTVDGVTHSGVSRIDLTCLLETVSVAVPLISDFGGVMPARRYIASAAAAYGGSLRDEHP